MTNNLWRHSPDDINFAYLKIRKVYFFIFLFVSLTTSASNYVLKPQYIKKNR